MIQYKIMHHLEWNRSIYFIFIENRFEDIEIEEGDEYKITEVSLKII